MPNRLRGNEYRNTLVCVDTYQGRVLQGRLYNPSIPQGETFHSLMEFLLKMEDLLDGMHFPQPFMASRAFAPTPDPIPGAPAESGTQKGSLATFQVRVIFRQNASWQGSVSWLEEGREESFRSALELLLLMDSAVSTAQAQRE